MPAYNLILGEVTIFDDTTSQLLGWDASTQTTIGYPSGTFNVSYFNNDAGYLTSVPNPTWGGIVGTLSSQTDLQTALDAKVNDTGDTMTGAYTRGITTLTDAATIAVNLNSNNKYLVVLGGNRTLGYPTNLPSAGNRRTFIIEVTQDATGGRTLAFNASYNLRSIDTDINLGPNERTYLAFEASNTFVDLVGNAS
jgi:hypothetical protein